MAQRKKEGEVTGLAIQGARATFLNQLPKIVIRIQRESVCDLELICQSRQKPDSETSTLTDIKDHFFKDSSDFTATGLIAFAFFGIFRKPQ